MFKVDHIAIWVDDLEAMKNYYSTFFDAECNDKYTNPGTGFSSYFLRFGSDSSRIEIMHRADVPENKNDVIDKQHRGYIHLAMEVKTPEEVDCMAKKISDGGYKILRGPRTSGDGYYEFETIDPENNRLEIICNMNEKN